VNSRDDILPFIADNRFESNCNPEPAEFVGEEKGIGIGSAPDQQLSTDRDDFHVTLVHLVDPVYLVCLVYLVYLVSRLLTKSASSVLAVLRGSTYGREYASLLRLLRPCWTAFLNSLRRILKEPLSGQTLMVPECSGTLSTSF
jgi:hypothetical protein